MKPNEIKEIKHRIIATIAKDLDGSVDEGQFTKHSKSPDYSLYGKNNFIKDAPKANKEEKV